MKRTSFTQKIFAFVFTVIVLFTVSVRETHLLFAEHHETDEHCQNHLHSQDEHSHCSVCKFDISFFTDEILAFENSSVVFGEAKLIDGYLSFSLQVSSLHISLRGPPVLV